MNFIFWLVLFKSLFVFGQYYQYYYLLHWLTKQLYDVGCSWKSVLFTLGLQSPWISSASWFDVRISTPTFSSFSDGGFGLDPTIISLGLRLLRNLLSNDLEPKILYLFSGITGCHFSTASCQLLKILSPPSFMSFPWMLDGFTYVSLMAKALSFFDEM